MAMRQQLGLKGLSMGIDVSTESDELLARKRGGNKRKRDQPHFHGAMHDRQLISEENEKKDAKKRRKEQRQEREVSQRPTQFYFCDECNKKLGTCKACNHTADRRNINLHWLKRKIQAVMMNEKEINNT